MLFSGPSIDLQKQEKSVTGPFVSTDLPPKTFCSLSQRIETQKFNALKLNFYG